MSLTETFALLAVIISLLVLLVDAVHVTFEITWKISHEDREHNKKIDRLSSHTLSVNLLTYG